MPEISPTPSLSTTARRAPCPHSDAWRLVSSALPLLLVSGAIACGGDDDPPLARISHDNVEELALDATDMIIRSAGASELGTMLFDFGASPAQASPAMAAPTASPGNGDDDPYDLCDTGSAYDRGDTIRFEACNVGGVCIFDGPVRFSISNDQNSFTARFDGLDVDCTDQPPVTLSGDRLSCSGLQTGTLSCRYELSRFRGDITGTKLRVVTMRLSGDPASSFSVDATLVDPVLGEFVMMTVDGIEFDDCPADVPSDGYVLFHGDGPVRGSIEFHGCSSFEVCIHPDAVQPAECDEVDWDEILGDT